MNKAGKLELNQSHLYEVEVNDNGDTIVFNREDITFPLKIQKMYEDCEKLEKETKLKLKAIEKKPNTKKGYLGTRDIEFLNLTNKTFGKMRTIMDGVLGKGACQKIFGDTNYLSMYEDLMDALNPILEEIGLKDKSVKEAVIEKYSEEDDGVI